MKSKLINTEGKNTNKRRVVITLTIVTLIVCAGGLVTAQQAIEQFSDDFEDGDAIGWEDREGNENRVVETGGVGDRSATASDGSEAHIRWEDGPIIDLSQEFTMQGVARSDQGSSGQTTLGFVAEPGAGGDDAILIFSTNEDATWLDTQSSGSPTSDAISGDFDAQWVNFEMAYDGGDNLSAKVWQVGQTEPSGYQMEREFDAVSGRFQMSAGPTELGRDVYVDELSIEGYESTDPKLSIDAPLLIKHGEEGYYTVEYEESVNGRNVTKDVTSETIVESLNTNGLTVDQSNNRLIATTDEEFNRRINIRAEYNGSVAYQEVTVASVSVENLEVLPGIWRFAALMGDGTIRVLLISIGAGIIGTRVASSFAGLGAMQLVITMGWLGGWMNQGIALVGLFAALFIGFNLAANIDYSVRR